MNDLVKVAILCLYTAACYAAAFLWLWSAIYFKVRSDKRDRERRGG